MMISSGVWLYYIQVYAQITDEIIFSQSAMICYNLELLMPFILT